MKTTAVWISPNLLRLANQFSFHGSYSVLILLAFLLGSPPQSNFLSLFLLWAADGAVHTSGKMLLYSGKVEGKCAHPFLNFIGLLTLLILGLSVHSECELGTNRNKYYCVCSVYGPGHCGPWTCFLSFLGTQLDKISWFLLQLNLAVWLRCGQWNWLCERKWSVPFPGLAYKNLPCFFFFTSCMSVPRMTLEVTGQWWQRCHYLRFLNDCVEPSAQLTGTHFMVLLIGDSRVGKF